MDLSTYFLVSSGQITQDVVGSESDQTLVVHIKRLFIIIHNGKHELQSDVMSFHHVAACINNLLTGTKKSTCHAITNTNTNNFDRVLLCIFKLTNAFVFIFSSLLIICITSVDTQLTKTDELNNLPISIHID